MTTLSLQTFKSYSDTIKLSEYDSDLSRQLVGDVPIDPSIIKNYDDFENIYRVRHNLIHSIICDIRGWPYGEKTVESILNNKNIKIENEQYYDLIKKQTPDFMEINGQTINMMELSISRSLKSFKEKTSKYALLLYFLKKNGFIINYEVIIINPDRVYQTREKLITEHKLNEPAIDLIKQICDNTMSLEYQIKSTHEGSLYFLQFYSDVEAENPIKYEINDVVETFKQFENKPFHSYEDFMSVLTGDSTNLITRDDNFFIDSCLDEVANIKPTLAVTEIFDKDKVINNINKLSLENSKELVTECRSIFPLPYISLTVIDSSIRTTDDDIKSTFIIASKMSQSDDPIIATFGLSFLNHHKSIKENADFPFDCKFSSAHKYQIALEGPNRKKYVKRPDLYPEHVRKQREHTLYSLSYEADVHELLPLSRAMSEINIPNTTGDIFEDSKSLTNPTGLGLDYVRICQSIFREVNINALRIDRRHKHIIKPTGVSGVYVLIYKGPKLRTGELCSQIWFKVIIDNEYRNYSMITPKWAFKTLTNSGKVSHSKWLSTDANRLDHYLRCFDKILMSYYTLMNCRYRTTYDVDRPIDEMEQENATLVKSIQSDTTNTLGLIIMTYMENRRSTSKMLQHVRFLVMTSVSIFKYYNSVFDKCLDYVRSPLQLYYLKKMIDYGIKMNNHNLSKSYNYGSVRYDSVNKVFMDNNGGARLLLPRPLVDDHSSIVADFSEVLSEMYFTMLFNKNQDDPTHASFQILSKMLEGEVSMKYVKSKNNHLGYKPELSDEDWAKYIIHNPHTHQFSRKAIEIGSKLVRDFLGDKLATDIKIATRKHNINKTIDEFATYKSSANIDNTKFDDSKMIQNSRRRCIEGVMQLIKEGNKTSFDVAEKNKQSTTSFQIFKKNQIGGVREILILTIESRIKINILETLSRNICQNDKREILTHGNTKNEILKECLFESRKKVGKRMSLFFSMDKSKWGPSFVPIQFLYLFTPHKRELGTLYYYIVNQLIIHQNKRCILPERLIRAWAKDKDNNLSHRKDNNLQSLKEEFLKNKDLTFVNESNMGQGILHYTSSYLHSAMISFRDELYKRACMRLGFDHQDHTDLFSSDDSFSVMSIEIDRMSLMLKKIDVFMRCQEVSERLFNCWTSKAKSSINPLIGEFNSLFMSNLTFFPTTLKFTLASVHPVNTDSFFRMVKESYASSRQIVENGGSLELYLISSYFNKTYCESIYHTGSNQQNDLATMGVINKPYQVGEYPIFNPALMMMFGPEYHNYQLFKRLDTLNEIERNLFINSHKILKGGLVETMAEMEEGDTMLGGLLRIEAKIGPIKQLERIKSKSLLNREELENIITNDLLILFRKPETIEDVKFKTCHKLFIPGAQEAVKTISASLYYGRVAASVSAKAFYIPNSKLILKTYKECVEHIAYEESLITNINDHIKFLYPKWPEYEMFVNETDKIPRDKLRSIYETQSTKTLSIFKVNTRMTNPISEIIKYMWMGKKPLEHEENRYRRDVEIVRNFYPMIKSTLQETKDQFTGDDVDKTKAIIMLLLKLHSLRDKSIKAIVYGQMAIDVRQSYVTLMERNFSSQMTHYTKMVESTIMTPRVSYNNLFIRYNYYVLCMLHGYVNDANRIWDDLNENDINRFMMDPSIGRTVKKRLFMPLLYLGNISEINRWTDKTSVILHFWERRQQYDKQTDKWFGNYHLTLFMGNYRMSFRYSQSQDNYFISKTPNLEDPSLIYEFMTEFCDVLMIKMDSIIHKIRDGDWIIKDRRVLYSPKSGFYIHNREETTPIFPPECLIEVNDDFITLLDVNGRKFFSIQTGLINCHEEDLEYNDKLIYGIKFSKLLKINAFTKGFDISYKNRSTINDFLEDLEMERPLISQFTKDRLGLKDDWGTRGSLDQDSVELMNDGVDEDPIGFLIDEDIDVSKLQLDWDFDSLSTFVHEFAATDFFSNTKTTAEIQFPKKTLLTIKNLKYDCVALMLVPNGDINKKTIQVANKTFIHRKNPILFSLISRYDRLVGDLNQVSPGNVTFNPFEPWLLKHNIILNDDDITFD
jgi:hypothetical protein